MPPLNALTGVALRGGAESFKRALADPVAAHALATKPTSELMRALVVIRLCQVPWLVENSNWLLNLAESTRATSFAAHAAIRPTFFKQFCAGETVDASLPVLARLRALGMGGILDCAVEADIPAAGTPSQVMEKQADTNMQRLLECIHTTHAVTQHQPDHDPLSRGVTSPQFAAVKLTSLGNPQHLREAAALISKAVGPQSGGKLLPAMHVAAAAAPEAAVRLLQPLEERLETLAKEALKTRVHLLIDAEQTYFQPAIDAVTCRLMQKYNQGSHRTLYTTYQAYLVGTEDRVASDLEWANRNNIQFGVKLVRGAYMVSERGLAVECGYTSPVHATEQATHECYDVALALALRQVTSDRGVGLVVATHNKESLELAVSTMEELGLQSGDNVQFAQLYGMSDHLSGTLASHHFQVLKYIPYGPIHEVMPYLIRRAQENSAVLGNTTSQLNILRKELIRRVRDALWQSQAVYHPKSGHV